MQRRLMGNNVLGQSVSKLIAVFAVALVMLAGPLWPVFAFAQEADIPAPSEAPVASSPTSSIGEPDLDLGTPQEDSPAMDNPDPNLEISPNEEDADLKSDLPAGKDETSKDDLQNDSEQSQNSLVIGGGDPDSPINFKIQSEIKTSVDESTGALTYSYPIILSPGRLGMTPELSVNYNSRNLDRLDSVVGLGWELSIPYIKREPLKGTQDLYNNPYFSSSLSGTLVPIADTSSTQYVAYRSETESGDFLQYTYNSDNTWTVVAKDGKVYTFGGTSASRQDNPSDSSKVYKWMVSKIADTHGNEIQYSYTKNGGQIYPDQISYTYNPSTAATNTVSFSYSTPSSYGATVYNSAFAVTTSKILSSISVTTVASSETTTTTYSFSNTDAQFIRQKLVSSISYSSNITSGTYPTSFSYSSKTPGWSGSSYSLAGIFQGAAEMGSYFLADFDGNGYEDILVSHYDGDDLLNKRILLNNGSSFIDSTSTWSLPDQNVSVYYAAVDVNGDHLPDLLPRFYGSANTAPVYLNTGSGFTEDNSDTWFIKDYLPEANNCSPNVGDKYTNESNTFLYDINNDGKNDIVHFAGENFKVLLNNGNGWTESDDYQFTYDPELGYNFDNSCGLPPIGHNFQTLIDINGDGLQDYFHERFGVYLNTGSGWAYSPAYTIEVPDMQKGGFGDLNGDGLVDIVTFTYDNCHKTYINNGSGFNSATCNGGNWNAYTLLKFNSSSNNWGTFVDVTSDGLVDVIGPDGGGSVHGKVRAINNGLSGWSNNSSTPDPWKVMVSSQLGSYFDINSDNVVDYITPATNADFAEVNGVRLGNPSVPNRMVQVTNTLGAQSLIEYSTVPTNQDDVHTAPISVVKKITTQNIGFGQPTMVTQYDYTNGIYVSDPYTGTDRFAGFNQVTRTESGTDSVPVRITETYFHQGNDTDSSNGEYSDHVSKIGKIYRVVVKDGSGNVYSKTINKWDKYDIATNIYFVKLAQTIEQIYDGNSTHKDKAITYTYSNSTGNLTQQVDWGEVTGADAGTFTDTGSDKLTTDISYATGGSYSVTGAPSSEAVTNQSSTKIKETRHYYDTLSLGSVGKGDETKTEQWKTSTTYINTQRTYNTYGLVTQELDARGKATNYTYDTYNLYPATVTNALSQATSYLYNYQTGKPKQVTDPNTRVYQTVFDGFGRVTEEKQPDLGSPSTLVTKTQYTYTPLTIGMKVQQNDALDSTTSVDTYTYFDGLGRVVQSRTEAEDSGFSVVDTGYNSLGQVQQTSLPYFSSGSSSTTATTDWRLYSVNSYDPLDRIVSTISSAATTLNAYDDWKVVVSDARGKAKNLYKDARGNLIKVEELNNTSSIGKGLNAYWKFDNNSNDELGASNGSDSSVTYATGKINQGAGYNGTSSYTAFPSSGALKPTGSFTLAGWLKTSSTSSFRTFFQSFNQDQGSPGYAAGIRAYISNGIPGIQIGKNTGQTWGSDYVIVDATTNIGTSGNWAYYAAVYDGSTVKIYINGTQQTSVSWTGNPEYSAVTYQRTGGGNDGGLNNNFFPGSLDEMGLWSRALSASEISQLYNSGNGLAYSNFDPDIYTTQYEYNGNNNLTKITDALGNVRNFTYDGLGRRLTAQDLHASADTSYGTWTYTYDDAGNTTSVVDPKSQTINYTYDDINRVLTENYAGATGTEVTYAYDSGTDAIGHLTSVIKLDGVNTANLYNPLGGLKQETKTIASTNYVTAYTYDRQGNQLVITSPDNSEIKYTYNTAGQLETVQRKESGGSYTNVVTDFDYSPHGQVTNTYYANGAVMVNTYDATKLYRLSSKVTTIAGGSKAQDISYAYDNNGNVTGITDNSQTNAKKTVAYVYDDLNRLTSATATNVASGQSTYTENYAYDAIGNITSKTTGPGSYTYGGDTGTNYANPHAATTIGSDTYTYDNNGNLTAVGSGGGGSSTIALDATSALTSNGYTGTVTKTWSHTTGSGSDRLLVLTADLWQDVAGMGTITSASYNGVAMTKATNTRSEGMGSEIWYLANPASGTHTVSVTVTGATDAIKLSASTFTGVDQTTPYVASTTATGDSGNPTISRTTTQANSLLVATLSRYGTTAATTNKTSLYNNATGSTLGAASYQVTSATGSYPDTYTGSSAQDWSMVASEFKPASSGGGTTSLSNTWDYNNRITQSVAGSTTVSYLYDESGQRVKYSNGTDTTYYPSQYYNVTGTIATKHIMTPDGTLLATVESSSSGGSSTPTLDTTSTSITNAYNGNTTKTWSHTTSSGSNRLLVLSADLWQDVAGTGTISSATYNGVALTKANSTRSGGMQSEIWYLVNPASGTNSVSVNITGATDSIKLAVSTFTNVAQSSPLDVSNTATGESGNPTISATTTIANDLVVATLSRYGTTAASTDQTSLYNSATGSTLGTASYQVASSAGSNSDTYTGSSANDWSMVMAGFKPVSGEGSSTTVHYVHTDHLTGSNVVTDASDAIEQTLDYYPYGSIRLNEKAGSFDEQRKFTGHEYDGDTGLTYMDARYYSSNTGRFISEDSVFLSIGSDKEIYKYLSNPQVLNSYSYATNNPLINIDIDGNFAINIFAPLPQSWQIAIGNKANNAYNNNAVAKAALDHPVLAGAAIGVASGALIAGGVYAAGGSIACGVLCGSAAVTTATTSSTACASGGCQKAGNTATTVYSDAVNWVGARGGNTSTLPSRSEVINVFNEWGNTNLPSKTTSILYHADKHGEGQSLSALTQNGLNVLNSFTNGSPDVAKANLTRLANNNIGFRIIMNDKSGGIFNTAGKIITTWFGK